MQKPSKRLAECGTPAPVVDFTNGSSCCEKDQRWKHFDNTKKKINSGLDAAEYGESVFYALIHLTYCRQRSFGTTKGKGHQQLYITQEQTARVRDLSYQDSSNINNLSPEGIILFRRRFFFFRLRETDVKEQSIPGGSSWIPLPHLQLPKDNLQPSSKKSYFICKWLIWFITFQQPVQNLITPFNTKNWQQYLHPWLKLCAAYFFTWLKISYFLKFTLFDFKDSTQKFSLIMDSLVLAQWS